MSDWLPALTHEFRRHKTLADQAIANLADQQFFARPAPQVNSVALIVKHLSGSMRSRWTDFLASDGEKPGRDRDAEFVLEPGDTRETLLAGWEQGWAALFFTLANLSEADLLRTVTIRGEPHLVTQALVRGLSHVSYHAGQILYVSRLLEPGGSWLTIAPGKSRDPRPRYLAERG